MRVLVVKMSSLGDVIHTLPALSDAARTIPSILFDWVVEEAFAEIPGWHAAVERVIPVAIRRWRKHPWRDFRGPEWRQARATLQQHSYDAVIDAQGLLKSALIARLASGTRHGMNWQSARERLAVLAYQHRYRVPRDMHAVARTRMLFASALNYPVPADPVDYGLLGSIPAVAAELPPGLLFFHGSARAEKLWPEERWIELAELARQRDYLVWLPWGSEEELERAGRIAERCDNARVLDRLDLLGLAGLLRQATGVVAVDTGLAHLAAALDVPTVSLYGPTSTHLIGTCGRNQVHLQSSLTAADSTTPLAMMQAITAGAVWHELQTLLPGAG